MDVSADLDCSAGMTNHFILGMIRNKDVRSQIENSNEEEFFHGNIIILKWKTIYAFLVVCMDDSFCKIS